MQRRSLRLWAALGCALCACSQKPAVGKEASETAGSSSAAGQPAAVTGTVKVKGAATLAAIRLPAELAKACGTELPDTSLRLGSGGELSGAAVEWADAPAAPPGPSPQTMRLDQKGCVFIPAALALPAGTTLEIHNSDALTHNVRAFDASPLFNVAMPLAGMKLQRAFPRAGVFRIRCDIHPFMHGVVYAFDHRHYALTDGKGHFRLEGVPSGRKRLKFLHPRLPPQEVWVDLQPEREASVEVTWKAADVR